eukprot:TRINITY_DN1471_c0_g1_i7.p1 TRINITY_DN1471_c0_g1~~TRINITY_DN1471_c0_g1_i7.p1  ORF type:complete len:149 (-),score=13.12 TRINITY_DN1471_c0_g1_i7:165-611(-)
MSYCISCHRHFYDGHHKYTKCKECRYSTTVIYRDVPSPRTENVYINTVPPPQVPPPQVTYTTPVYTQPPVTVVSPPATLYQPQTVYSPPTMTYVPPVQSVTYVQPGLAYQHPNVVTQVGYPPVHIPQPMPYGGPVTQTITYTTPATYL